MIVPHKVKNLPANAGDVVSIPGLGRYPQEGNGNPLQCSCLENPVDRGAVWAIVLGDHKKLDMTEVTEHNKIKHIYHKTQESYSLIQAK